MHKVPFSKSLVKNLKHKMLMVFNSDQMDQAH